MSTGLSFIFGGNTNETPDSIKRKRAIVQALISSQNTPRNVGEGLNALGDGIVANVLERRADAADSAGRASVASDLSPLLSGFGASPSTPGATGGAMPTAKADGSIAPTKLSDNDTYNGFIDTVKNGYDAGNGQKLAVTNPFGLAAIAATGKAESGYDPKNAAGSWNDGANNAGGVMSWNGPRLSALQKFAGGSNGTPQQQGQFFLQENPDLITALNNAKSVDEAQHLMNNAWAFKGYNQPGNANAANRLALARGYLPRFQGQTQVASLDPSSGMGAGQPQSGSPVADVPPPVAQAGNQPINPASASPAQMLDELGSGPAAAAGPQPYRDPMVTTAFQPPGPNGAPPSAAPPLPAPVDVASIPNTPGSQPPPPNPAQIPAEFQNSQQLMNADPTKGIMPALLGGQPAPSGVASALAASQPSQSAPQGTSPVAQALASPQAGPQGAFPAAPGASATNGTPSAPSTAVAQALTGQQAGPDPQQILKVLTNPFATPEQRSVAQFLLERQQQQSDPLRQLQIQDLQTKIDQAKNPLPDYGFTPLPDGTVIRTEKRSGEAKPVYQGGQKPVEVNGRLVDPQTGRIIADYSDPKTATVDGSVIDARTGKSIYDGAGKWTKLDNFTMFNEKTGEVKATTPAGGKPGAFRFGGDSVEGQALNGMMASGLLTEEQAQQVAAGKQISGPNGEILFMTPQGLVSQPANGGAPKLVSPVTPAPQPANQGINLFPNDPPLAALPNAAPAPIAPAAAPQPVPAANAPVPHAANVPTGAIQLTGPKAANGDEKKAMTFADRMTTSGKILDDIGNVGTDAKEALLGKIPLGVGNMLVSDKYQSYDQARRDFINAQLRRESGAAIAPSEFDNANKQYFPQPGDSESTIKQKAANRRLAINGMIRDGGPTYTPPNASQPSGNPDIDAARAAIGRGASRDAVIKRLQDAGIDPSGL